MFPVSNEEKFKTVKLLLYLNIFSINHAITVIHRTANDYYKMFLSIMNHRLPFIFLNRKFQFEFRVLK